MSQEAHDCSFLADVLPDGRVSVDEATRAQRAADFGAEYRDGGVTPDAVVRPESTEEVSTVLAAANERGVPVTPYAAGSGLEGAAVPSFGGISLDLGEMDAILDVRPDDFQVDVQPGVIGADVDEAVADHGLFFPPLPSSGDLASIGGMIATDASGMQTVKYGEVADWVLRLEAVLADGTVITAGSRAKKTSAGYNLKDLIVGSEGTLAVVTEATLELAGRPAQIHGGRAIFPTLDDAADAVFDAVRSGVDVARIELMDPLSAAMANEYLGTDLPDAPMTFVEFHANHGIEEEIDFCRSIFEAHDVSEFEIAPEEEMDELWRARKELGFAMNSYDPDLVAHHPGDVTVPISALPEMVSGIKSMAEERDYLVSTFGHAGDGNVHYAILVDPDDPDHVEGGDELYHDIVELAIDLGGTSTGEHGIGLGKREFLVSEHGEASVEVMRSIKRTFDPKDTLNPGKLFPETVDGGRVRGTEQ